MNTVTGCITSVIFSNHATKYAVLVLQCVDSPVVIPGKVANCSVGDSVSMTGEWVSHPVHKRQCRVQSDTSMRPSTVQELSLFFSSGVIAGIGPHGAKQLVDAFGDQLIHVLDDDMDQRFIAVHSFNHSIRCVFNGHNSNTVESRHCLDATRMVGCTIGADA